MVVLGGVSGNCLASLSSIDQWIEVLNSDVAASARTGYKTENITFGGGTTRNDRPYTGGRLGIQYAEQALNVGSTNIDFSQGQVVASTEFTHAAINGSTNAFFTVVDNINTATGVAAAGSRYYLTRDGEFHRDINGYMVNAQGLYLMGLKSNGATFDQRAIQIPTTDPTPETTLSTMIDNGNLALNAGAVAGTVLNGQYSYATAFVQDLSSLKYSKYGSTILESQNSLVAGGFPNGGGAQVSGTSASPSGVYFDQSKNLGGANPDMSKVKMNGSSLEASNVQLPSKLVELSLAQKIYSALTKVIQIDAQKIDGVLNLIR